MGNATPKPFRRVNTVWTMGGPVKDEHKDRTE